MIDDLSDLEQRREMQQQHYFDHAKKDPKQLTNPSSNQNMASLERENSMNIVNSIESLVEIEAKTKASTKMQPP